MEARPGLFGTVLRASGCSQKDVQDKSRHSGTRYCLDSSYFQLVIVLHFKLYGALLPWRVINDLVSFIILYCRLHRNKRSCTPQCLIKYVFATFLPYVPYSTVYFSCCSRRSRPFGGTVGLEIQLPS